MPVQFNDPLPASVNNEQAVIGAVFIEPAAAAQVDFLKPEHFSRVDHQLIWQVITEVEQADYQVVLGLLKARDQVKRLGDPTGLGGAAYLRSLEGTAISSVRIKTYALEVYKAAILRKGIENAIKMIDTALRYKGPEIDAFCDQIEELAGEVAEMNIQRKGPEEWPEPRDRTIDRSDDRYHQRRTILSTGLNALDAQLGGLEGGLDVLVGARTSIGKTELVLSITYNLMHAGKRVLIFSPELPSEYLVQRLIQMKKGIGIEVFKRPDKVFSSDAEFNAFITEVRSYDYPVIIDDTPGITPIYIRNTIKRVHQQQPLDLVILDRGNLMEWPLYARNGKAAEVQAIGNANKATARMLNIPLIETVQINRAVEGRQDRRPRLSDIMYGGEQAPDIVALMYRDDYYNHLSPHPGIVEVNVAKNRHGGILGTKHYRRHPVSGRIVDL